jgi:predicted XRE-type DNA-binding protein
MSYELFHGKLIPDKMFICHKCDNPPCCNPNHLFIGTHQDNMDDKVKKHRQAHSIGELSGRARHNWEIINKIRKLWKTDKYTQQQLGLIFEIDQANISEIILNKKWHDPNYTPDERINHRTKLTWEIVNEIRRLYTTNKYTYKQLAKKFQVCIMEICRIINNKRWIIKNAT